MILPAEMFNGKSYVLTEDAVRAIDGLRSKLADAEARIREMDGQR